MVRHSVASDCRRWWSSCFWRRICSSSPVLLILLIASATQQTMLAQATDEPEGGLSQPLPSAAIKFGSYGADKDEGKDTDRAKEASVKHLQGEEMCSVAAKSGETSGSGQSPTRASSEVASEGASAASKSKKKKGKAKPEGPIAPLPPPSGEVAQLLHLLQRKSFHHLLEQEDKEGALLLLKLTEKFMAGGNMGLAEPVIDAVAVSLADQIAKVAKKDRPGMVAVLRALVDQQIDPEIKRRRYEALFAPAESGIVVLRQSPETISLEELCLEEEKETEMRKKSPKTKAKKGKFKQQKKKDIEEGDEGPTPPELEEKAKHNGKGKKSKDDNKKEPPLTTALVPNGNELLVQLKDVTKWLLEKSSQPKKSKKTKTPSEEEKEGEKEASVWTTRDKRTNQALTLITKWTPKLLFRIRVLAEMDARRLPTDVSNPNIVPSAWIDTFARQRVKAFRNQFIAALAPLHDLPELIDVFLRFMNPKPPNMTDRVYGPRLVKDARLLVEVSQLPVFSRRCSPQTDIKDLPACLLSDPKGHSTCSSYRAIFIHNCYFMIMGSQVVEHKPDEVAELLALLRHFTPDEEEFVGWYFHNLGKELGEVVRLRSNTDTLTTDFISFEEVREEIVRLLAVRSLWDPVCAQAWGLIFDAPKEERQTLFDELRKAQPKHKYIAHIWQVFSRHKMTPPTGANDQEGPPPLTFLGGLLVWLKRLTEVNEELPGLFQFPLKPGEEEAHISPIRIRGMDLVDCRIELASDLWPIRDGERRKRVYAAIREACLDEGHIMFVLLTPELATDMWVNDYGSEGTLQGKLLVNEDEYVENMIKAIELAGSLLLRGRLSHTLYSLASFFTDPEMRQAQVEAINQAGIGGDSIFVNTLASLDQRMAVLADFCARASVSADQAKGTSRWRNMPIDGRLRVQWRKALREEVKIPVEAFHAKLLEYWRISGLIRKGRWRRVSAELEDREQLSKDLAELVWLLANVHPIAERYKLISIFIMPKETTTTGEPRLPSPDQASVLLHDTDLRVDEDNTLLCVRWIAKFVSVFEIVDAQANLASHSFKQKYQLVKSLLCLPPEKRESMFHQFLDAQSRQAMDRIAEEKHLPVADFAAKMAGHLDELETGLQKAFDRLPSDGGAGEKVVSMRQLLARESQHGSLAVVSSSKKAPSSPSSHAAAAAGSVTTEEAGTSGGTKSSSKKKKKKPSAGPAKKSGDGGPSGS